MGGDFCGAMPYKWRGGRSAQNSLLGKRLGGYISIPRNAVCVGGQKTHEITLCREIGRGQIGSRRANFTAYKGIAGRPLVL